jgi:hypothetical protein
LNWRSITATMTATTPMTMSISCMAVPFVDPDDLARHY